MKDADSPRSPGLWRQKEIYALGLEGRVPGLPVRIEDLERRAKEVLGPEAYDYVAGGAGSEDTVRANCDAFRRWRIEPRFLRDVDRRDLDVEVLGQRFPAPFLFAPVGVQSILHPDAELAVARAARAGHSHDPEHPGVADDRGGGGRAGGHPALVPALLARERRDHGEFPPPGGGRRL